MTQKTAAFIAIGNELLSGRTQDMNLNYLAKKLDEKGIDLREARFIKDDEASIIEAVRVLSAGHDYLFTSGGIGPTHDDITVAAIAQAFCVPVVRSEEAYQKLAAYYGGADLITPARAKMAHVPEGASLIDNIVSSAPGIRIGNMLIMAGVPRIMQAMLDNVLPTLMGGAPLVSQTLVFERPESELAQPMAAIQKDFPDVEIGSYPQYREGRYVVSVVLRGADRQRVALAASECENNLKDTSQRPL